MTLSATEIYDATMALTEKERFDLMDRLHEAMGDRDEDDEAWLATLDRRAEELKSGVVQGIPWENVQKEMEELVSQPRVKHA